ncbi:gid protein [Solidesulfovibrio carbinoliphilus subsp. oakridgensis]|uniref:Methylenetetrahydrofolate--tRNA-(uracil-5-)-methyltransferase TrmFO n=1 Tax=Solidesulfovibrio carbinoliphilus subsp. oakridgensis TaxID=694327 RepID=G7Q9D3_9BACT|nr:methylenetetrahydrofolate--tRNA-(uracil(54)-C(5))-methyltransferase (FADH(2)-oxidizing) TrmFO [Solidesulfovibrio carbinoliphilus]EHJ48176.1 gid protein [Solidesulfovibrio carbinoliphilus subsp. oakridgensis]
MSIAIIGGGLAGCECALALARAGVASTVFEAKPARFSPAHVSPQLAELVCSNSLRSDEPVTAVGLLKVEMAALGSAVIAVARETAVPAGKALAVDRELFAAAMTARIEAEPLVTLTRQEIPTLDDPALTGFEAVVVAAGPLASESLAESLGAAIGGESLYFYDAIAPIVATDSVDMDKAFWASRWQEGEGDYCNCPLDQDEYKAFLAALLEARKVPSREFEKELHFEGCLPIETMAERGERTLTFGPMKPVGLTDPRTGRRPYAVVQLRPENAAKSTLNLVGFQTKLAYGEQERVFRLIPALHAAEFTRLGSIHRNTFVNAPKVLNDRLELVARPGVYLAGQITGVEGYVESAACGLWLGTQLGARIARGLNIAPPPVEAALGALLGHLRTPAKKFQPSNVNFGLTPPLEERMKKANRKMAYPERAAKAFAAWRSVSGL